MTTTDPAVVIGIVLATTGTYLLLALAVKYVLDEHTTDAPDQPAACPAEPLALHAHPAALDETAPLTCVQPDRARHRKGPSWT